MVFIPEKSELEERIKEKNIPCERVPLKKLFLAIKRARPSLIHCNSATTRYTLCSALAAKLWRIPFVWHVRVVSSAGWRDKLISSLCTKIIAISRAVEKRFNRIAGKNKVVMIHNAVDTMLFKPGLDVEYLRDEFQIEKNRKIVGIFSRLDPWKGHRLFLEAARDIHRKFPKTIFLVVGEGEKGYEAEVVKYADEQGLKTEVIFTGFRKDIPELMNLCHIVVNPSAEPEPFGRTLIEAMACGKAVVATKMGGPLEVIEDEVSGVLVAGKNAKMLAQACIQLLENREKAEEMGLKGRERAIKLFSAERATKKIEEIYEELCR